MSDSIRLCSAALECPDAKLLAAFYAEITGGKVTYADDDWAVVKGPNGRLDFQTAPGYMPPTWPDPASSMFSFADSTRRSGSTTLLAAGSGGTPAACAMAVPRRRGRAAAARMGSSPASTATCGTG